MTGFKINQIAFPLIMAACFAVMILFASNSKASDPDPIWPVKESTELVEPAEDVNWTTGTIQQSNNKSENQFSDSLSVTYSDEPNEFFSVRDYGMGSVYTRPKAVPPITAEEVMGESPIRITDSIVKRKITDIREDLLALQREVSELSQIFNLHQDDAQLYAAEYYASIGTINAQLRAGTTPGNPRLVKELNDAQANLQALATGVTDLNVLSVEVSKLVSVANYLLEATRVSFGLSGGIEEDHVALAEIEDAVNNTIVVIDRLVNNINDGITRTASYLASERSNLRILGLAVSKGQQYGKSLSNKPFSNLSMVNFTPNSLAQAKPTDRKLVAKIKFDRPNVNFEQPVYMAVSRALEKYPAAKIDLVAVHPQGSNAAKVAIESTKTKKNAEQVLRVLTQMGVEMNRVNLFNVPSPQVVNGEVHIYVK